MKKSTLSVVLSICLVLCSVIAVSAVSVSSEIDYFYYGNQKYGNAAKVDVEKVGSTYFANAYSRINTVPLYTLMNEGHMGATAELYDASGKRLKNTPFVTNSEKSYYCNSLGATVNSDTGKSYYARGFTYVWYDGDYQENTTYNTRTVSATKSKYSINDNGQTYGSALQAKSYDEEPDLIAAIGNEGKEGYIYKTDVTAGHPKSPAEALAQQQKYEVMATAADGGEVVVRTIPLYSKDGKTVIGEYDISFTLVPDDIWD